MNIIYKMQKYRMQKLTELKGKKKKKDKFKIIVGSFKRPLSKKK